MHLRYSKIVSSMSSFPQRRIIQAPSLPYCQKEKSSLSWLIWFTTKSFLTLIHSCISVVNPIYVGIGLPIWGINLMYVAGFYLLLSYLDIWKFYSSVRLNYIFSAVFIGFLVEVMLASFIKRVHYHLCPCCFLYCTLKIFSGVLFPPPASCWAPPSPGDEGDLGLLPDSLSEAMIWTLEFGGRRSFLDP